MQYLLNLNLTRKEREWLRKHFLAIGFANARPLNALGEPLKDGEREHAFNSQRVEFRLRTNIERRVSDIVEEKNKNKREPK